MTAVMNPVDASAYGDRNLRLLPIAANLLPREVVDARFTRKVRRTVLVAVGAFVVVIAAWFGLATWQTSIAEDELTSTQERVHGLQRQQGGFKDLIKAQTESTTINTQLTALMKRDMQWSSLVNSATAAAAPDVTVTTVNGALNAETAAADYTNALPSTVDAKTVGTISFGGTATSKAAIATYIEALAKVNGLANPMLNEAQLQNGQYQFTIRMDVTDVLFEGRYTKKTSEAGK